MVTEPPAPLTTLVASSVTIQSKLIVLCGPRILISVASSESDAMSAKASVGEVSPIAKFWKLRIVSVVSEPAPAPASLAIVIGLGLHLSFLHPAKLDYVFRKFALNQ